MPCASGVGLDAVPGALDVDGQDDVRTSEPSRELRDTVGLVGVDRRPAQPVRDVGEDQVEVRADVGRDQRERARIRAA
jgi:hypothetical protein